jgi:hypothetical protein
MGRSRAQQDRYEPAALWPVSGGCGEESIRRLLPRGWAEATDFRGNWSSHAVRETQIAAVPVFLLAAVVAIALRRSHCTYAGGMTRYRFLNGMGDVVAEDEFADHEAAMAGIAELDQELDAEQGEIQRVEFFGPEGDWRWAGALPV